MPQNLTTAPNPPSSGALQTASNSSPAWLAPLRSAVVVIEEGHPLIPPEMMPTSKQLQWISRRAEFLTASLNPQDGDDRRKAIALSKLFLSLGGAPTSEQASEAKAGIYLDVLAAVPAWAVEDGAMMWMRGQNIEPGENNSFVPSPPQLMRLSRKAMAPVYREIAEMQRLAKARPYHKPGTVSKARVDAILEQYGWGQSTASTTILNGEQP